MKTIIAPVDFSPASEKAIQYIAKVFCDQPFEVELIYVSTSSSESDEKIGEAFRKFKAGSLNVLKLPYRFQVRRGNLLDEIQTAIHELKPAFVIMGTGKTSLANALVKLTDSSVILVPENTDRMSLKRIVYANDFNDIKESSALGPLLNLSRLQGATVHIIHVGDGDVSKDKAEDTIEYYMDHVDHEYMYINSDDIVKSIQNYVTDNKIDLLAVLIRDHGKNDLHTKGRLIEQLVTHANVPVLNLI